MTMRGQEKIVALLRLVARGEALFEDSARRVLRIDDGTALRRHAVQPDVLQQVLSEGFAAISGASLTLTAAGRSRLHMLINAAPVGEGASLHDRRDQSCESNAVLLDTAESPLAWLYRRRGSAGRGVISEAEFGAGERLRTDFTKAGLMPSVSTNWRAMAAPGGGMSRAELTDYALAARDRVQAALAAIGPELAGTALDVCCFLKGLEQVENERSWPQRSAKVVLLLALKALARHYGLADEASGRRSSPQLVHWGAPGYRPSVRPAAPE